MGRMWAIIERELRRFRRSPVLIVMSMTFPIVQLVVLGYAFGGNVKHLKVAVVDYADQGSAISDLRNGRVNGVLTIPAEFSRRVLAKNQPRVALIEDNTDNFVSSALAATLGSMLVTYNQPAMLPRIPGQAALD